MTESDLVDAPEPTGSGGARGRWLLWALVLVAVVLVPLTAARLHYGGQAGERWDIMSRELRGLDSGLDVRTHGEFPPCSRGSDGRVERTYVPDRNAARLVASALRVRDWTAAEDGRHWTLVIDGEQIATAEYDATTGVFLATSTANPLACLLG